MNINRGLLIITMLLTIIRARCRPVRHSSHKTIRQARIHAIQDEILLKLGLTAVPNVSRVNTTVDEKRRMIQMYKKSVLDSQGKTHELFEEEEFFAKTFHSILDTGPPGRRRYNVVNSLTRNNNNNNRFHFKMNIPPPTDANRELHLNSAVLKVFKHRTWPHRLRDQYNIDKTVALTVYMLKHAHLPQPVKKLIATKIVSLRETGWEEFDVRKAVEHWLKYPTPSISLEIVCESQYVLDIMDFVRPGHNGAATYMNIPSLNVYIQEKEVIGRARRSPEVYDCVQGDGEKRCCRYPLWVSFRDIAWDQWVVEPEGYQAYYCDGTCPHQYKTAHTFAGIKSAIHLVNPAAAPEPCCTNTKLSPLTLLHYDEMGLLKVSQYSDMVVQECKCA